MSLLLAWIRSLAAYVFLCLYIGLLGPPALLVTTVTGRIRHLFVLGVFGARTARQLLGIRLRVEGLEHVVGERATVYCMNHCSNVDAVLMEVLYSRCPRLRVLYKAEMGRLPILGRVLRMARFVPVERADRDRAIHAVDVAVEHLVAGDSFLVAPEGTRSSNADMRPFKKGGFVMAIKAQVPVVPIGVVGPSQAMPRGQFFVKAGVVRIRIGEPVPCAGLAFDDRDALSADVRARIQQLLS
ncbi:MAG: lysophospholipid acyltransferase family protein [Acidobacteriota bacterium]